MKMQYIVLLTLPLCTYFMGAMEQENGTELLPLRPAQQSSLFDEEITKEVTAFLQQDLHIYLQKASEPSGTKPIPSRILTFLEHRPENLEEALYQRMVSRCATINTMKTIQAAQLSPTDSHRQRARYSYETAQQHAPSYFDDIGTYRFLKYICSTTPCYLHEELKEYTTQGTAHASAFKEGLKDAALSAESIQEWQEKYDTYRQHTRDHAYTVLSGERHCFNQCAHATREGMRYVGVPLASAGACFYLSTLYSLSFPLPLVLSGLGCVFCFITCADVDCAPDNPCPCPTREPIPSFATHALDDSKTLDYWGLCCGCPHPIAVLNEHRQTMPHVKASRKPIKARDLLGSSDNEEEKED